MSQAKKILIVDDEESMRLLMRRILEAIPALDVTLADGSAEGLRLAAANAYDLILLDLLMPGLGGIELLTRIRLSTINKPTPVIIVSVIADPDTRIVCESLGVRGYVVKPIDRSMFFAAVNKQLGAAAA